MNNYQKTILERCNFSINNEATVELDNNNLTIKQCENAYIKKFELVISTIALEAVIIDKARFDNVENMIKITIDLDTKKDKIVLIPKGGIVDPIELNLVYIESDKDKYDEMVRKETIQNYRNNSNAHLVKNIFGSPCVIFNPCCEDYSYTEVEFIATSAQGTDFNIFPNVEGDRGCRTHYNANEYSQFEIILERKRNKEGCNYIMFEPIGRCGLVAHIYQYDKNGNLLIDYSIS